MNVERIDSQQTTMSATATIDGRQVHAASASVHIRPGKLLSISVSVTDEMSQLDENARAQVGEMLMHYICDEMTKAAGLGIPLAVPVR